MADESTESPRSKSDQHPRKHGLARRRLLKSLAAGGVVAGVHVVPDRWVKPVVDHVVVPAHAQASGRSMTAFLTFNPGGTVQGPATTTVDGVLEDDNMNVDGQATLIPSFPSQPVTLSFAFNAGGGADAVFNAGTFPQAVASDPGTGVAAFGNASFDLDANTGIDSDLPLATLTATFSSPGVPPVIITVDFA